ncbi:MAG: hypothetical protein Alpg2KO_21900 [Alphaproteobacteria bacterium]
MSEDKLPEVRDPDRAKTRLVAIVDKKVSLQSMATGLATIGKSPLRMLERYWRLDGNVRSRGDRWMESWRAMRSGLTAIYDRRGKVLVRGRDVRSLLQQAATDKIELQVADLQGMTLKTVRLDGLKAPDGDFRNVFLNHVTLDKADLRGADFSGARIRFFSGHLGGMRGADLSGADFSRTRFKDSYGSATEEWDISGAKLEGTRFRVDAPFHKFNMRRCDLSGVILIDRRGNVVENMRLSPSGALIEVPAENRAEQDALPKPK